MFQITDQKGFWVTFENGCTISVQFGRGNYSDHYRTDKPYGASVGPSKTAEVAAWDAKGDWIEEDPRAYQNAKEVLDFMNYVASLPA